MSLPAIELVAVATALVYVVLAARNSDWCWPFGFVSSCLWAYQVWVAYDLLFDMLLNSFYAVMAVIGWIRWRSSNSNTAKKQATISESTLREHLLLILGGVALSALLAVLAEAYTSAQFAFVDALTTVGSVIGTVLLIRRKLSNWLYLLAMDIIYVWLYLERGSPLFAGLFVVYCVLAVYGYLHWRAIRGKSRRAVH